MRKRFRHRIILGITFSLISVVAVVITIPGNSQEQKPLRKTAPRRVDENRFPIADYSPVEPPDPSERSKRNQRGKKYDKSDWRIYPDATASMARVDYVNPALPAIPLSESTAVILGQVTDAKAYLSNDKTGVYSVFSVQVIEVLRNSSQFAISNGSAIEVEREGGRVRFPNGRILTYAIGSYDMPQPGLRYVLFLTNPNGQVNFQILTGYELRDGRVYPLDNLPNLYRYENADETNFLTELHKRIANH